MDTTSLNSGSWLLSFSFRTDFFLPRRSLAGAGRRLPEPSSNTKQRFVISWLRASRTRSSAPGYRPAGCVSSVLQSVRPSLTCTSLCFLAVVEFAHFTQRYLHGFFFYKKQSDAVFFKLVFEVVQKHIFTLTDVNSRN